MKTIRIFGMAVLMVIVCSLMAACSSNDDENEGGLYYYLWFRSSDYKENVAGTLDVPCNSKSDGGYYAYLMLQFENELYPDKPLAEYNRRADWYLECNASWIMLENRSGKVTSKLKRVNLTIQDNESDREREAIIYLTVPDAINGEQSLILRQYGRSHRAKTGENYSIEVKPQ